MSGVVGKRVCANVPGLGEAMSFRSLLRVGDGRRIRARSRALASRGSSTLRGTALARGALFGRHSTVDSELARTWGIRLSN